MSFWSELKRRHVVKVALAYAIVGLAVGEGVQIFLPEIAAPEWVPPVVLVLIILGFPVALVLAWAYDMTPEGVVRTSAETPASGTAAVAEAATSGTVAVPEAAPVAAEPQPPADRRGARIRAVASGQGEIRDVFAPYIRLVAPQLGIDEDHPRYLALARRIFPDEFGESAE